MTRKWQRERQRRDRDSVGDRDGWACHLCVEAIDPALQHPEPMAAVVDHLVPSGTPGRRRRQGDQWDVAIAHAVCNLWRGNADVHQARAIRIGWKPGDTPTSPRRAEAEATEVLL